jgi:hypothetical protein
MTMVPVGVLALATTVASAGTVTVNYPYIDVIQLGSDLGVSDTGGALTIQGTADAVIIAPGSTMSISPAGVFTLNATYQRPDPTSGYDFTNGSLTVTNGGSSPLLSASFSDLVVQTGVPTPFGTSATFTAPLTYTGGSLAGSLSGGVLLGSFLLTSSGTNLSQDFAGDQMTAKVGTVVPLPASLPLLLAGLCGLGGLTARAARPRVGPAS